MSGRVADVRREQVPQQTPAYRTRSVLSGEPETGDLPAFLVGEAALQRACHIVVDRQRHAPQVHLALGHRKPGDRGLWKRAEDRVSGLLAGIGERACPLVSRRHPRTRRGPALHHGSLHRTHRSSVRGSARNRKRVALGGWKDVRAVPQLAEKPLERRLERPPAGTTRRFLGPGLGPGVEGVSQRGRRVAASPCRVLRLPFALSPVQLLTHPEAVQLADLAPALEDARQALRDRRGRLDLASPDPHQSRMRHSRFSREGPERTGHGREGIPHGQTEVRPISGHGTPIRCTKDVHKRREDRCRRGSDSR